MSRITDVFAKLREQGRTALIPFITAGDPQRSVTAPLLHALVEAGADLLELGIPFSDPMADGPVIQRASERALANGINLGDCLEMVRDFRTRDMATPMVLMGYLNPIEVMGYSTFAERAAAAGVDGVLVVDAPPEEGEALLHALRTQTIDSIYLLAPTSTPERIRRICAAASGFVYYVSLKGVTGAGHLDVEEVRDRLELIRSITQLPVGVGFGIKDAATAVRMAEIADAVVVGSAIVHRIEILRQRPEAIPGEISSFLGGVRAALDGLATGTLPSQPPGDVS